MKNEARLLPSAIEYHLAAGCSRIYLFWDGTTDNSAEMVQKYPQVIARNSHRPEELQNPPAWLSKILPAWEPDLDVRSQTRSTRRAMLQETVSIGSLASIPMG